MVGWNIRQLTAAFEEKVMMVDGVGVEIDLARRHQNLAQQAALGEAAQRVIDRGQRYRHLRFDRLVMQRFGADMPFTQAIDQ